MKQVNFLASIATAIALSAGPVWAQVHGGNGGPVVVQPGRPEIQPPVGKPQPPRPPRPEIQPPRPGRPEPPRPVRPEPPRPPIYPPRPPIQPPITQGRLELYSGLALHGRPHIFTGSAKDLKKFGAADQALSLRATGRWQVCSRTKYRGTCQIFNGRVLNLSRYGLARQISSIRYLGR